MQPLVDHCCDQFGELVDANPWMHELVFVMLIGDTRSGAIRWATTSTPQVAGSMMRHIVNAVSDETTHNYGTIQ